MAGRHARRRLTESATVALRRAQRPAYAADAHLPRDLVLARFVVVVLLSCCAAPVTAQTARAFEHVSAGTAVAGEITAVAVSRVDASRVYFGTDSGDLWASEDGGISWAQSTLSPWDGRPARPRSGWRGTVSLTAEARASRRVDPSAVFDFRGAFDASVLFGGIRQQLDQLSAARIARESFDDGFGRQLRRSQITPLRLSTGSLSLYRTARSVLDGSIRVNWIEPHPMEPLGALAATTDGVYETDDGGLTWVPIFDGTTDTGEVRHAAWNPWQTDEIFVSAARGLFLSDDRGLSFYRSPDGVLTFASQQMVEFHPTDPDGYLMVGSGVRRHRENRLRASRTQWGWREAVRISLVRLNPRDPDIVLAGTDYGLLQSHDGGDTFAFATEPMLFGSATQSIAVAPDGSRAAVTTGLDVWETTDFAHWELIWSGSEHDRVHFLTYADDDHQSLWMASSEGVRRLWIGEPWELPVEQQVAWVELAQSWPTMGEAIHAAHERLAIERDRIEATSRRARRSAWLPMLEVAWFERTPTADAELLSQSLGAGVGDLQRLFRNGYRNPHAGVAARVSWDLTQVIQRLEGLPTSHGVRELVANEHRVRDEVTRLHTEHARLMLQDVLAVGDRRACVNRRLRLDQVRTHLDLLTDDLYRAAARAAPTPGACP